MSKIQGPCFSLSVRKAIGKKIIFSRSKNRNIAKSYFKPSNPNSPGQQSQRNHWLWMSNLWKFPFPTPFWKKAFYQMAKLVNPRSHGRNMMFREYGKWDKVSTLFGIANVHFDPLPPFTDVYCTANPGLMLELRIVKGPNTGFTKTSFAAGMGFYIFSLPPLDPSNFFQITIILPGFQGWTGYYSFLPGWWI